MTDGWDFGVLGTLHLGRGRLTAPKQRGLLALLLLDPAPVPVERVRDVLDEGDRWRDATGPMYVTIHRLRRWLDRTGGHRLEREPGGYRLVLDAVRVDAVQFRRLVTESRGLADPVDRADRLIEALSLWRGPVAADAPDAVRRQYAAHCLERLHREAVVDLAETCLASNQAQRALPPIEQAAVAGMYDEQLQSLYALILAACGLPAEALAVVDRTRRTLAADLGVDPGDHLRAAHRALVRQRG
jgi:DNA-binding SARP family transcriptional activator